MAQQRRSAQAKQATPKRGAHGSPESQPTDAEAKPAKPSARASQKTDWEAVERDYRTSRMTLREMADKHGCLHTSIANKAKREGWSRDLTDAVRKATNASLMKEAVTKNVTSEVTAREQGMTTAVHAAAELNKQVILAHRSDIREARDVAISLLAELRGAALLAEHAELLAQVLAGSEAQAVDEALARQAVQRALAMGSRIGSLKSLAEALTKLQAAERKAFGLDDEDKDADVDPLKALLTSLTGRSSLPVVKDAGDE